MKPGAPTRAVAAARTGALVLAVTFFLVYAGIAVSRMAYPFELEWMEGGVLDHVRVAAAGEEIYEKPNLGFVSYLYPPLYYYLAAVPASLFGMEFHSLRLLSFLSSLGCMALIFALVRKETENPAAAVVAAGLYAATFARSGGWMDLARVDSLFMCLLLAGVFGIVFARRRPTWILTGVALAAAAMVKQSALVICLPVVLYVLIRERTRGLWWIGSFFGLTALSSGLLDLIHDGWFRYYCFTLPRQHPVAAGGWTEFWTRGMLPLAFALVLSGLYFYLASAHAERTRRWLYLALAVGMVGSSWSVTSVVGAWHNNLMPAFAALAILAGLGLHRGLLAGKSAPRRTLVVWLLVLVQFAVLLYDPREHLPTAADRAAGESLVERLRTVDGEIFIPNHGYLAQRVGKPMQAHTLAMDNVFLDDPGPAGMALRESLLEALRGKRWAVAIVESDGRYLPGVQESYRQIGNAFDDPDVFWPVTGGRLRPEYVFVPK